MFEDFDRDFGLAQSEYTALAAARQTAQTSAVAPAPALTAESESIMDTVDSRDFFTAEAEYQAISKQHAPAPAPAVAVSETRTVDASGADREAASLSTFIAHAWSAGVYDTDDSNDRDYHMAFDDLDRTTDACNDRSYASAAVDTASLCYRMANEAFTDLASDRNYPRAAAEVAHVVAAPAAPTSHDEGSSHAFVYDYGITRNVRLAAAELAGLRATAHLLGSTTTTTTETTWTRAAPSTSPDVTDWSNDRAYNTRAMRESDKITVTTITA
eukprot:m.86312 g.86312  ORF g.86312 m.86312 type:complete len:271 (-) comp9661_c0_seq1:273-1085(-)